VKYPPTKTTKKMEEATKKCSKCGKELPVSMFNKCKSAKDGLQARCRECHSVDMQEYIARRAAKETAMAKVYSNPELAKFQPRELIKELQAR
jgi:DNA-directed RNA polymerase subunit RPC12/RpoP